MTFCSLSIRLLTNVSFLVSFCLPIALYAQKEASLIPFAETANFKIEALALPGGEAANTLNCMVQGPDGFLWMGSHDGLHRYDGREVITYKINEGDAGAVAGQFNFSYVENLYWDGQDKLWICTYGGGLYRFDPATEYFEQFSHQPDDPFSISNDRVMCAVEDVHGNLWIGTEAGLNRFDRTTGRFHRYLPAADKPGSLSHANVRNIYLDRQGTLWIATGVVHWQPDEGGLNRYDPETDTFVTYYHDQDDPKSLWTNAVQGMLEDRHGNFWVATTGGLQRLDRQTGQFERMSFRPDMPHAPGAEEREMPAAWSLLEDREGGLWVGTIGGYDYPFHLLRYDPEVQEVEYFPVPFAAWQLCQTRDGTIWLSEAGEGGGSPLKITRKRAKYDLLRGTQLFDDFKKTELYRQISFGPARDQWFGPTSMAFDPSDSSMWLSYILKAKGLDEYTPRAILANHDQETGASRFYYLDQLDLRSIIPLEDGIDAYRAIGMAVAQDGRIWGTFASDQVGLYCFDPRTQETVNHVYKPNTPNTPLANQIHDLMMDRAGRIWISQHETGLSCLDPKTGTWTHYRPEDPAPFTVGGFEPMPLLEDSNGKIWTAGLTRENEAFITALDPVAGTTENFPAPPNFPVYNFPRTIEEVAGDLFFSLYVNGLGRLLIDQAGPRFEIYNPDQNNFPIVGVADAVTDRRGQLWVASNTDHHFVALDPTTGQWFSFLNTVHERTLDRSGILGPDGHIYFLNWSRGWTEIDPTMIDRPAQDSSRLQLTNLYLRDQRQIPGSSPFLEKPIWAIDRLDLQQIDLPLTFHFSTFHFLSAKVVYLYRLYPYETEWKRLYSKSALNYSYLPVGDYRLQVKAYHHGGLAYGSGIDLPISIAPPWWRSGIAYAAYLLLILSILWGAYSHQRRRWQLQTQLQLEQERADRLNELNDFKSRFYTNITHEFRTPLTVIKGMTSLIDGHHRIKLLIQRNSDRLLDMVNELLELSRLESSTITIDWVQADVVAYLKYLIESFRSLAEKHEITMTFCSEVNQLMMDIDEYKIQQILTNLLSNAIKFTPAGGAVNIQLNQVVEEGQAYLEMRVQDTGIGIAEEKLPYVFDRFYQVDDSSSRIEGGSGIGLALIRELLQLLAGRITVTSTFHEGSVFTVYLPIRRSAPVKDLKLDQPSPEGNARSGGELQTTKASLPAEKGERPQLLIIEDNPDLIEYVTATLRSRYELLTARDGRAGIDRALEHIPDVIISDVMMPEMDGFAVCRQLKSDRRTSHIPIVLLTAKATQEDKVTGLSLGADAYLMKPFDPEELLVRLENLTELSLRLRESLVNPVISVNADDSVERREAVFLQEVNDIIDSRLEDEEFDTRRLCEEIAMSRAQLHRKLKALTGRSTADYIRWIRLQQAKALLDRTDLLIGEVASRVGYKDVSHFSRSFLKEFGVRPSEMRGYG